MPLREQGFDLGKQLRPQLARVSSAFGDGLEISFEVRPADLAAAIGQPLPIRRHNAFGLPINYRLSASRIAPRQQVECRHLRRGIDPKPFCLVAFPPTGFIHELHALRPGELSSGSDSGGQGFADTLLECGNASQTNGNTEQVS